MSLKSKIYKMLRIWNDVDAVRNKKIYRLYDLKICIHLCLLSVSFSHRPSIFISMDDVSGLEEGSRAIFPDVIVQRCIVPLIRNSIKYVPSKDYKALRKVYGASSLETCASAFESFQQQ